MTDASAGSGSEPAAGPERRPSRQGVWHEFRRHKGAVAGAAVFSLIALAVLLGSVVHGVDPQYLDYPARNQGMSPAHPLGTDNLGRDMLAQVLSGGRISLAVAVAAMVLVAEPRDHRRCHWPGSSGGSTVRFMRLTDLFLALPVLPLLLVGIMLFRDPLRAALGPEAGIFILIVAVIGMTSWMQTARVVRGEVLAVKEREFVLAARSVGAPSRSHHPEAHPAQRPEPHHGGGHAGNRQRHHHRKRAQLSRPGLPLRLPHLGPAALRRRTLPRNRSRAGDLAGAGHLAHRPERELHGATACATRWIRGSGGAEPNTCRSSLGPARSDRSYGLEGSLAGRSHNPNFGARKACGAVIPAPSAHSRESGIQGYTGGVPTRRFSTPLSALGFPLSRE